MKPAQPAQPAPTMRDGVIQRGSTWSYVVRERDIHTGKTKPRWVGGFPTEEAARDAKEAAMDAIARGEFERGTLTNDPGYEPPIKVITFMSMGELRDSGLCDPACMLAAGPAWKCTCTCEGAFHGMGRDSRIRPRKKPRRDLAAIREQEYVTVPEAAKALGISRDAAYAETEPGGSIPTRLVDNKILVPVSQLIARFEQQRSDSDER